MCVKVGDDMKQLSKRERMLLYILICMVVFIGGIFLLVMPSFEKYTTAKSSRDTAVQVLASTKKNMPDYTDVDEKLKTSEEALEKVKKLFYSEMEKEDVDQIITSFTVQHNLNPVNLNINSITTEDVISYEDYVASQDKSESSTEEKPESTVSAKVYDVSLTVTGTVEDVQQLVNDANNTYSMKIASVQYSNQIELVKQMTITFKIYMI